MRDAVAADTCPHRPMHARSSSPRLAWLRKKTSRSSSVPSSQPHRAKASGSASRPGPVVALSRLSVVPVSANQVVSGTSYRKRGSVLSRRRPCATAEPTKRRVSASALPRYRRDAWYIGRLRGESAGRPSRLRRRIHRWRRTWSALLLGAATVRFKVPLP
eukprot:scaffold12966_cov107-Isochrysis_galbana.AAC.1